MNKRARNTVLLVLSAIFLSGCAVRTTARVPAPAMPESYKAGMQDTQLRTNYDDLGHWWKEFNDPLLDSLVQRSIEGNFDLRIAEQRVLEARATRGITAATRRLPNTGIGGGYSDGSGQNFASAGSGLYQTGFDTSYEIDLFGGARASVLAAQADAEAAQESMHNVLITVVAETARNYLELRQAEERLALARRTLVAQEETLRLVELRLAAGLTSEFDTTRARAQAESTRAGIPMLEAQVQRSMNAVALLLGEQPATLQAELSAPGHFPAAPPAIPVGLPSDLLRRRPDILQAEREISGAAARVGVAVSNFYPKFSLTGRAGEQSNALLSLLSGAANVWSYGTSFSWGLLNYPATKANIEAAKTREEMSMMNYERAILTALTDVENALTTYSKEKERQPALERAVEANRKALELAQLRHEHGLSSFLEVLDAQRSLYSAEDSLTQSRANLNTNVVALYKALGGGWL